MHFLSDRVARAMHELFAIAGLADDVATDIVHFPATREMATTHVVATNDTASSARSFTILKMSWWWRGTVCPTKPVHVISAYTLPAAGGLAHRSINNKSPSRIGTEPSGEGP